MTRLGKIDFDMVVVAGFANCVAWSVCYHSPVYASSVALFFSVVGVKLFTANGVWFDWRKVKHLHMLLDQKVMSVKTNIAGAGETGP